MAASVEILSTTALHPASRGQPITTPVSIADSAVAEYAPTAGTWFFPRPTTGPYDIPHLVSSLKQTLDTYRHLCGTLTLSSSSSLSAASAPEHSKRYGRVWITYGLDTDPGVSFAIAKHAEPLDTVLPRHLGAGVWDSTQPSLCDTSSMVKLRPEPATRGPAVFIQLIEFACGSLAIGVAAQHVLLDARALAVFMGDWATRARGAHPSPRTYEPLSLDVHAAGDVDAEWADAQLETTALQIPQLRLDFWSQRPGHPEDVGPAWFSSPRSPAAAIDEQDVASGRRRGRRVPWDDWRWDQSTLDRTIEFLPEQVEAAYRLAGGDGTSRLDAVLGCVWAAVVRGRDLPPTTEVRLHTSVDLRRRVTPPLDDTFLGAPLINVMSSSSAGSLTLSSGARAVRAAVDSLASDAVPALLHHMSFALDPVREWNCFLGERDVLTTSWLGAGCYDVDFGFGPPSVVQPGMPPVDGLLVAMDVPGAAGRREDKWYNSGVRVRLILRKEVMDKVLADPALRPEE